MTTKDIQKYASYAPENHVDANLYVEHVYNSLVSTSSEANALLTEDQKKLDFVFFLEKCKASGLNPLNKEIYGYYTINNVRDGDEWIKKPSLVVITGIDGFRKTGNYAGIEKPKYTYKENGELESCEYTIYTIAPNGERVPNTAVAFYDEYKGTYKKDGKIYTNSAWLKMPHIMLAKCAEALLRRQLAPQLAGLYIKEEMQQAENPVKTEAVVTDPVKVKETAKQIEEATEVKIPVAEAIEALDKAETLEECQKIFKEYIPKVDNLKEFVNHKDKIKEKFSEGTEDKSE